MKRLPALLASAGVVLLGGCASGTSQAPVPVTYPRTEQQKMQAAHHWDVLADYEAARILDSVKDRSKPVFVSPPGPGESPFGQAYFHMLREHLIDGGAVVVTKPVFGGVTVDYETQVLAHTDRGYVAPAPGTYTAIGAGALLVGVAAQNWSHPELAILPFLLGADILSGGHAAVSPTEVIVTTRVTEGDLVVMSDSDVFYMNPGDSGHYLNMMASRGTRTFPVTGE